MAQKQYKLISAATTNAKVISALPSTVTTVNIYNANAAARYVKLYNKATTPAPATDTALLVNIIQIPATSSKELQLAPDGLQFSTGLGIAITGAAPLNDATAIGASDVFIYVLYNDYT